MIRLIFVFIVALTAYSNCDATVSISPSIATVIETGSVQLTIRSSLPLSKYEIQSPRRTDYIFNPSENNSVIPLAPNVTDTMRLIESKIFVIIISNISRFSEGDWRFSVTDNEDITYDLSSRIRLIAIPSPDAVVSSKLGSFADINCNSASLTSPSYCTITNNEGKLVSESCSYRIDPVIIDNEGMWTCKIGLIGSMEEITHTVELKILSNEKTMGSFLNDGSTIELRCELQNSNLGISWCRAVSPTGQRFMLTEGLVSNKISSVGTNLAQKICGLEIKLPLNNDDVGRWRLDLGRAPNDYTGCFFNLPDETRTPNLKDTTSKEVTELMVNNGGSFQLQCSVPWPIAYCYARHPNGELMHHVGSSAERLFRVGMCQINIMNAVQNMTGKWSCIVPSYDSTEEVDFSTNVLVISNRIVAQRQEVRSLYGQNTYFKCVSPRKHPMRYCRFVSPSGQGFSLHPDFPSNSRYAYWGAGLENGECGIWIKSLQEEDIGNWTCATSFITPLQTEERSNVYVTRSEPGVAFIIGLSIGGIILVTLVTILVVFKLQKRKKNVELEHPRISPRASDSNLSL